MSKEFDPHQYTSFQNLPKEQISHFKSVKRGESFVLKTAEKNPGIAQRLAMIENHTIDCLQHEIDHNGLILDSLLSRYQNAISDDDDYSITHQIVERIKQVSDYAIFRGGAYDERVKVAFRKQYVPFTYSAKTEQLFLERIEPKDSIVKVRVLLDERFSSKRQLVEPDSENDQFLEKLYTATQDNIDVVNIIVRTARNPAFKIEIFKSLFESINQLQDTEKKEKKLYSYSFWSIKHNICETLIRQEDHASLVKLIDEGFLQTTDIQPFFQKVRSDSLLLDLACRSKNSREVLNLFKFIADSTIFSHIIAHGGDVFVYLSGSERQNMMEVAKKFEKALNNPPKIYAVSNLGRDANKFVVGIASGVSQLYIAWGNTKEYEYHRDIFSNLSYTTDKRFPEELRSGGYVRLVEETDFVRVVFDGRSGDFGAYGDRVLEKFHDDIVRTLQLQLERRVVLDIKISE